MKTPAYFSKVLRAPIELFSRQAINFIRDNSSAAHLQIRVLNHSYSTPADFGDELDLCRAKAVAEIETKAVKFYHEYAVRCAEYKRVTELKNGLGF